MEELSPVIEMEEKSNFTPYWDVWTYSLAFFLLAWEKAVTTTDFPVKWSLWNFHPWWHVTTQILGSASVNEIYQYGISAPAPQTLFHREIYGSNAKFWPSPQAIFV